MLTRYCSTCGLLMGRKRKVLSYDQETGKPIYEYRFKCAKWRFYTIGHSSLTVTPTWAEEDKYYKQSGD